MKKLVSIVLLSALPAISFAWWGDQRVSNYEGTQASVETAGAEHKMYGEDFTRFKTLGLMGSTHVYTVTVSDAATTPVLPGSGQPTTDKHKKYW